MKLETFFEKFDQLADAPDSVAKMRELVLRLAMSAKLVEQDSNELDGPKVFNAIQQARAKHPNSKKISFVASTDWETAGDDCELPNSWHRCAIGDVCDLKTGATPSTTEPRNFGGNARWLLSGDINQGEIFECEGRITELGIANSNCKLIPKDSVLIALNGQGKTRATVALLRVEAALNQSLVAMIPYSRKHLIPEFLFWNLRSRYRAIRDITGHEQRRGLNMKLVGMLSLPLPPVEEQKRIVARVEVLMALCDRLEAQQKEREAQHAALTCAAIARFTEAPTSANLSFLFHRSYSIAPTDIRKTILDLAVRGKLVTQDPRDESAEILFGRIQDERDRYAELHGIRVNESKRKEKAVFPFKIPVPWEWTSLSSLFNVVTDGDHLPPPKADSGIAFLTIGNITTGHLDFSSTRFVPDQYYRALAEFRRPVIGDILYTVVGATYGRPALVDTTQPFCIQRHIAILRPAPSMDVGFLLLLLKSPLVYGQATASTTGTAQPTVPLGALRSFRVPLPPISEQRRIAAKASQLMTLADQLELQLVGSVATARKLLEAVVNEMLHPSINVVELPHVRDHVADRAAIGCYAIQRLAQSPNFGRTVLMKVCYLSETHLGLPLGWQPMRQAAGPWDPWVQDFESLGTCSDWFTVTEKALNNGHSKIEYSPKNALKAKAAEARSVLGNQKPEFDRLLNLFADKSTEEAEIITTLFAAWNDFLIDGKSPTDDEIIHEVRENWHRTKERFTPGKLGYWLSWMRENRLIPSGHGPRTRQQLTLHLN
jgi:type I restriction enzyme, S subunit